MVFDVIIIGSGPAGLTAAIYATRAYLKTLVVAGTTWGGQLMLTTDVENFPGFPEGILGPELMQKFRDQAQRFKAEIVNKLVTKIDFTKKPFTVWTEEEKYQGLSVIVATGADTRWLDIPGEHRLIGRGVSSCAPCDAFFFKDKKVIVVGGGDSAMEEALVLTKFASSVTIVHRRGELRASKILQERAFKNDKISFIWNTEVKEVLGEERIEGVRLSSKLKTQSSTLNQSEARFRDASNRARAKPDSGSGAKLQLKAQNQDIEISVNDLKKRLPYLEAKELERKERELIWELPIEGMFVAIGHVPNTAIFRGSGVELDEKGYVKKISNLNYPISNFSWLSKENQGKDFKAMAIKYPMLTSVEGIFTSGDVHDYHYRQAITAAGFGCMAAMDSERWLENQKDHKV